MPAWLQEDPAIGKGGDRAGDKEGSGEAVKRTQRVCVGLGRMNSAAFTGYAVRLEFLCLGRAGLESSPVFLKDNYGAVSRCACKRTGARHFLSPLLKKYQKSPEPYSTASL